MFVDRRLYVEGTIQYFQSFLDIFGFDLAYFLLRKEKMCCLSFPQLPARFSQKVPDVREMAKMTAGKFAIHYFFSSYVRRFKIISKNRLFYNHFYLFHLCCLYHDYRKKDFTHLAVRVVNLRNHIKRTDSC